MKIIREILPEIFILSLIFMFITAGYGKTESSVKEKSEVQNKAPDFEEFDISGKNKISLRQFKGKVVLINFWATWCPPCREEIPDFVRLQNEYKDNLSIIGISVDQDRNPVQPFYINMKMNYPVIFATEKIVDEYGGISAIPTSFLVNQKGELVKKIIGYRDKTQWESEIKNLTGK